MNKKKRTVVVGKVCFTSERIVVADPAYEVDSRYVVCLNIIQGEYTYYANIKQEGKSEFVSSLSIVNAQTQLKKLHTDKLIGRIMVDVGFAGFLRINRIIRRMKDGVQSVNYCSLNLRQ